MVRLTGPMQSQKASKQLAKSIIFKTKGDRCFATKYNKPGSKKHFVSSDSQNDKREIYGLAVSKWRSFSDSLKAYWNGLVVQKKLVMSGWNYFYKMVVADPEGYLGSSVYGVRFYGYLEYGQDISNLI